MREGFRSVTTTSGDYKTRYTKSTSRGILGDIVGALLLLVLIAETIVILSLLGGDKEQRAQKSGLYILLQNELDKKRK